MTKIEGLLNSRKEFLGECLGIALTALDEEAGDLNVIINILVEDDGTWLYTRDTSFSSYWLPEFINILTEAEIWIKKNCKKSSDGKSWEFKE